VGYCSSAGCSSICTNFVPTVGQQQNQPIGGLIPFVEYSEPSLRSWQDQQWACRAMGTNHTETSGRKFFRPGTWRNLHERLSLMLTLCTTNQDGCYPNLGICPGSHCAIIDSDPVPLGASVAHWSVTRASPYRPIQGEVLGQALPVLVKHWGHPGYSVNSHGVWPHMPPVMAYIG